MTSEAHIEENPPWAQSSSHPLFLGVFFFPDGKRNTTFLLCRWFGISHRVEPSPPHLFSVGLGQRLIPLALSFRLCSSPLICRATLATGGNGRNHQANEAAFIRRAADLAEISAGLTSPHPKIGCVVATSSGKGAGEGYLYAGGTKPSEALAVEAAGEFSRGSTAYLKMEPGDCHGDHAAVSASVQAGIGRVVVGIRHPMRHLRGSAIRELRSQGIVEVNVLGEDFQKALFSAD